MKPQTIEALVDEGRALKARIAADGDRLKEISVELVTLGSGTYEGSNGSKATVVVPSPSLKPTSEAVEKYREELGPVFKKLFDAVTTYKPVKAFREVAGALLTPAKARKIVEACEVPGTPYVKFS